jgi:cellulose biosynthesis protein BcsQ
MVKKSCSLMVSESLTVTLRALIWLHSDSSNDSLTCGVVAKDPGSHQCRLHLRGVFITVPKLRLDARFMAKPSKSAAKVKSPKRIKRIALFNHKGGVSKTTTTFNLGWMMASMGHRVVLVDADPQCSLSGLVLGYKGQEEFEAFYKNNPERNIRAGLAPAFESRPKEIEGVECVAVEGNTNLFLLPGHIRLSEWEVSLGMAQELSGTIQTLQNLPGSISYLLSKTAQRHDAEYVLVDMNPSLSSINQNLFMTSDYFIVPASPDYFSVMAIDSLATVFPRWRAWSKSASSIPIFRDAAYPLPTTVPKFLGTIIQNFRVRDRGTATQENESAPTSGTPAAGFQKWIDDINAKVKDSFVPVLREQGMLFTDEEYHRFNLDRSYCLAEISAFNSLIAKSQQHQVPIFSLTDEQIALEGEVLIRTNESKQMFDRIFRKLATIVVKLTTNERDP